jgi:hypothetical protein
MFVIAREVRAFGLNTQMVSEPERGAGCDVRVVNVLERYVMNFAIEELTL